MFSYEEKTYDFEPLEEPPVETGPCLGFVALCSAPDVAGEPCAPVPFRCDFADINF